MFTGEKHKKALSHYFSKLQPFFHVPATRLTNFLGNFPNHFSYAEHVPKDGERKSESEPQMKLLHTLCCIILTIMIILPAATKKHSAKTTQFSHFSFLQCVYACAFLHILHIMSFAFIFACIAASPQQNKAHNLAS